MKLHYLAKNVSAHIHYSVNESKEFLKLWHYHPEIEMVYIVQGTGTLYVGDFIGKFQKDNIFLLGSNLPHMFDSDKDQNENSKSIVLHINKKFLDKFLLIGMEYDFISYLMDISKRGIFINDKASKSLYHLFNELDISSSIERQILTTQILYRISQNNDIVKLGSSKWSNDFNIEDNRLNKVLEYIMMHFKEGVDLNTVCNIAGMNKSAFCRYFKQNTRHTFVNYVNNIKINYACRLLNEKGRNNSISMACFESGFNSLSYFNRIFKKHLGCSPSDYLK